MVDSTNHLAGNGALNVAAIMLVLWIIYLLIRNAAIVDVGWAAGLAILAGFYAYAGRATARENMRLRPWRAFATGFA
jgi:steroid 5-alpha reductase family enzyme